MLGFRRAGLEYHALTSQKLHASFSARKSVVLVKLTMSAVVAKMCVYITAGPIIKLCAGAPRHGKEAVIVLGLVSRSLLTPRGKLPATAIINP